MTLSEKIILLSATLWLAAIAFIAYTFIVQARLQAIIKALFRKIDRLEKALTPPQKEPETEPVVHSVSKKPHPKKEPETTIKIDKNEPLSKYETVTLPDEININFVDR